MKTIIHYETNVKIGDSATLNLSGIADVDQQELARALRWMVAGAHGEDDAGTDYFYDVVEGIVCIGGEPGWWNSRSRLHVQLLMTADMLDGCNFSFSYKEALRERAQCQR